MRSWASGSAARCDPLRAVLGIAKVVRWDELPVERGEVRGPLRFTKVNQNRSVLGLPQNWGSGRGGHLRKQVIGGVEALPEAGAERAIVDGAANLEQPVGAAPGPAHLLRFGHPAVHQKVGRALGQRRADPQPSPVPLAVVDQPVALWPSPAFTDSVTRLKQPLGTPRSSALV